MFSYLWCSKNGTPPPSKAVCGMVRMDDVKSGGTATLWSLSYIEIHTQSELIYIYIYICSLWPYQERFRIFWSCQSYEYDDERCLWVCTSSVFELEWYKHLESRRRVESYIATPEKLELLQ